MSLLLITLIHRGFFRVLLILLHIRKRKNLAHHDDILKSVEKLASCKC